MVAVFLEEDVTLGMVAEVLPVLVFAAGYQCIEYLAVALIFQDLAAVEPVLDMVALHLDPGGVPAFLVEGDIRLVCGDEVVERAEGAVAGYAELGIRMQFVVEDLELAADGRGILDLV